MSHLITPSELETLTSAELRLAFNRVSQELHVKRRALDECDLLISSLEEIEREWQSRILITSKS